MDRAQREDDPTTCDQGAGACMGNTAEDEMKALIEYIKKLFGHVPVAPVDEHCPYCRGLGYDSSGFTCPCLREKK
jgi:hypothetical protein